jgi:hypothetical protein
VLGLDDWRLGEKSGPGGAARSAVKQAGEAGQAGASASMH